MFNVIPAIDLLDNQVVRLRQGRYSDVTYYEKSPLDLAKSFQDSGATHLHIVDLNGARDGSVIHGSIIESISNQTSLTLDVGGGIRSESSISFYLNSGVDHIILGSLFISDFKKAAQLAQQFHSRIIAGVDAKQHLVATDGWESTSSVTLDTLLKQLNELPIHAVIYTDIAKDGMMQGPNLDMLSLVASHSHHPVIASGGIRDKKDVDNVRSLANISGCIVGKALLSQHTSLPELLQK